VLKPIRWTSVRRNEVGAVASDRGGGQGILIEDARQQRAGLFLRDVAYRLYAELEFIPPRNRGTTVNPVPEWLSDEEETSILRTGPDENPGKYNAMFERRARKGQCFNQPYLGTREFSCSFILIDDPQDRPAPVVEMTDSQRRDLGYGGGRDLGFMLYDMVFPKPGDSVLETQPAFFRAKLENGVIVVPPWESEEVRR
jgi:CRISPR-associated protein Cas5d